jgi:hypothetical protein
LGTNEAQWFWHQPELEAQDQGNFLTLTVVGCHWGPVILTSARIGSPELGRFPYSHCGWVPLRPSDSDFSGCHWGPVILTSARIGSPELGRFPYSHCGWAPMRPSDSDISQNWKPRTREISLLSLWLGATDMTEAQWFWLQPELEAQDQGDFLTLTVVGCHWGPVILTSARIGSPGPGRFPYSHCGWAPMRPSDSDFGQNWKPGTGEEIPLYSFRMNSRGLLGSWITGNPHTTRPLINQSRVELTHFSKLCSIQGTLDSCWAQFLIKESENYLKSN